MDPLQLLGLLSIALLWLGLLLVPFIWPMGRHYTFSQHVATSRAGIVYYVVLFGVTLPPLYIFFTLWFQPTLQLPVAFSVIITISLATQLLCTLVPELPGPRTTIHRLLAAISALCLIPASWLLITTNRLMPMAIGTLIVLILISLLILTKYGRSFALYLQIIYYASFFLLITAYTLSG